MIVIDSIEELLMMNSQGMHDWKNKIKYIIMSDLSAVEIIFHIYWFSFEFFLFLLIDLMTCSW